MSEPLHIFVNKVHCRIGSLEITVGWVQDEYRVHCRIGSLEKSEEAEYHRC